MDIRYCNQCGEAFLISKGSCVHCLYATPSQHNTGVKTALLLGLLSIGVPSQASAAPPNEQSSEKPSKEARSSSRFTITFAENATPVAKTVQEIETVIQSHLSKIEDRHKQHKNNIIARTLSLQLQIINGTVTKVEVRKEPHPVLSKGDLNPFIKAIVQESIKWVFPKKITQQFILNISINTNRLSVLEGLKQSIGTSKPGSGSGALYGVPQNEGFGGVDLNTAPSVSPKYGDLSTPLDTSNKMRNSMTTFQIVEFINWKGKTKQCQEDMHKTLRKYLGKVKHCHITEMKSVGEIDGDLLVELIVNHGKATVRVKSNSTGSEKLAKSVEQAIQSVTFPPSCAAKIKVHYSLKSIQPK